MGAQPFGSQRVYDVPTRYREVVLTLSKHVANKPDQDENRKTGFAYAAGITLFAAVATFCGLGWLLDKWLGTEPWCLIGGIVLGSAVGLFEFVRLSSKTY